MVMTPAQRRANQKYDKAHYKVVGTKVTIETAETFADLCKKEGTTVNKMLQLFIDQFIQEHTSQ